ncbi:MAG: hypothetical protein EBR62_06145 [Verrucomicrobia bacterium]|nr:hypothetical protein [Verrucomicrobiota bacterium]
MAPPRDDFGAVRPIRRFNRLTQALLAIGLAVTINYLASQTEFRFRQDLTWDHRHSLAAESAETVRVAGRKSPVGDKQNRNWVRALVLADNFSEADAGLRNQLGKLLEAYKLEASRTGSEWFNILQVSNGLNQEILSEVAARHGPPGRNIGLILTCGTRAKFVTLAELVDVNAAKVVTFRGEEAVTSALLEGRTPPQLPLRPERPRPGAAGTGPRARPGRGACRMGHLLARRLAAGKRPLVPDRGRGHRRPPAPGESPSLDPRAARAGPAARGQPGTPRPLR